LPKAKRITEVGMIEKLNSKVETSTPSPNVYNPVKSVILPKMGAGHISLKMKDLRTSVADEAMANSASSPSPS
jgi:hypothetical protein